MEEKKKEKFYIIAGVSAILILIIIGLITNVASNIANHEEEAHDHGADDEYTSVVEHNQPTVSINLDFLTNKINIDGSNYINNAIREIIKNNNNESSSLTVTIPSSSIIDTNYFPYKICNFNMEVSDGTIYNAQVVYEKGRYFGVLIQQIYPQNISSDPELHVVFLVNPQSSNYSRDEIIKDMEEWAKTITASPVIITTKDLY